MEHESTHHTGRHRICTCVQQRAVPASTSLASTSHQYDMNVQQRERVRCCSGALIASGANQPACRRHEALAMHQGVQAACHVFLRLSPASPKMPGTRLPPATPLTVQTSSGAPAVPFTSTMLHVLLPTSVAAHSPSLAHTAPARKPRFPRKLADTTVDMV